MIQALILQKITGIGRLPGQPHPDQFVCLHRYVNADPLPVQPFCRDAGGRAAAEGIEDHIAFIAGCLDDPIQQGKRFLGGVAYLLISSGWRNVQPQILKRHSFSVFQIFLVVKRPAVGQLDDQTAIMHLFHPFGIEPPCPCNAAKIVTNVTSRFIGAWQDPVFPPPILMLVVRLQVSFIVIGELLSIYGLIVISVPQDRVM